MGWFLSKKKSGTSRGTRGKKKSAASARPDWDPKRTMAAVKVLVSVLVVVTLALGWHWSEKRLRAYVHERATAPVTAEQVELIDAPAWMGRMRRQEITALVAAQIAPDPMNQASLAQAAYVLSENPWVQQVDQLWRLPDGRVAVAAHFREPVAVVRDIDGYRLVDDVGIRLPGIYLEHQLDDLPLPLIVGVASASVRDGEIWPGDDLQAGLALVREIGHEPYAHEIRGIDVSHRDVRDRIRLVIYTERGLVRWGLPPHQEQAIEPPASVKKRWLMAVHRERGSIDAQGKMVDLYGAEPFIHPQNYDGDVQVGYTSGE